MFETLLTIDELNAMDELSANTLYAIEVAHLPSFSLADERELVTLARAGNKDAATILVLSTLRYTLGKARATYNLNQLVHDDLLDLVQVASLAMLEDLDRALQRDNPVSYLRGIARRSIVLYCIYRGSLISKPASLTRKEREKRGLVTVESLDAPLVLGGTFIRLDVVEAPESDPITILEEEERSADYAVLYQALETLAPRERQVLTLRFGLDGQPGMLRDTIGELIGGTYDHIDWVEHKALNHLRKALAAQGATLIYTSSEEK